MKELLLLAILHGTSITQTQIGISRGLHESNPFVPHGRVGNAVVASVGTVGQIALYHWLAKTHPVAAKRLAWLSIGIESSDVVWNTYELSKTR